jgi:hypothetical protein
MGRVMNDAYELRDCTEAVPFEQIEDNVYNEIMLMINVDAVALVKLLEVESELLNKLKVEEAKYYTDGSDGEEEEKQDE